jgi:hypothetical protein
LAYYPILVITTLTAAVARATVVARVIVLVVVLSTLKYTVSNVVAL